MSQHLLNGSLDMKKLIGLAFLIALYGCTENPTSSNPIVTQTLTISSNTTPQVVLNGSGTFYDITANTSTPFTISNISGTWNFQTGKHDTVEFTITFTAQCTFNYSIGTTQSSAATNASDSYTSSEITF
jgi:hypothetical protein